MTRIRSALVALLPAICLQAAWAQDTATSFKSTEVKPGIFMLEGADGFAGGNVTLLTGAQHIVLIDDGLEPLAPTLVKDVTALAGRPIDYVINTHVHGDHTGGNATFAEQGGVVVAQDNVRRRLIANAKPGSNPDSLPMITFSDDLTFHVNGEEVHVFHIKNAHTDGDAAIQFGHANVICTGDIMFNHLYPFIDLASGGDVDHYIAGQQRLLKLADDNTLLIPGHGALAHKSDLQRDMNMLIDARDRVHKLIAMGLTENEVVARNPLADYDAGYSWDFINSERMTRTIYQSLSKPTTD